jgi:hypothetical protein
MTLLSVWIRRGRFVPELVVAADSRLTGGLTWDGCPKIMTLPRSDCMLAFAGDTLVAYPLMLQIFHSIEGYEPSRTRRLDVTQAAQHALAVANQMRHEVRDLPQGVSADDDPKTAFLVAGYSWRLKRFAAWRIVYQKDIRRFTLKPVSGVRGMLGGQLIKFIGDGFSQATRKLATKLLEESRLLDGDLNMEPLEILMSFIADPRWRSIGGAPQVVKVYQHMNTQSFAVKWPDRNGGPHFFGRPLLPYERLDVPTIDPWNDFKIEYGYERPGEGLTTLP